MLCRQFLISSSKNACQFVVNALNELRDIFIILEITKQLLPPKCLTYGDRTLNTKYGCIPRQIGETGLVGCQE